MGSVDEKVQFGPNVETLDSKWQALRWMQVSSSESTEITWFQRVQNTKLVFQIQLPFGLFPLDFPSSLTIPPQNIKPSHAHFSSCVLACSSLTCACMLSTWSSSFLMLYISCCFSSSSSAAVALFLSSTWHLTEQGKKGNVSCSPFHDGFGTLGMLQKESVCGSLLRVILTKDKERQK